MENDSVRRLTVLVILVIFLITAQGLIRRPVRISAHPKVQSFFKRPGRLIGHLRYSNWTNKAYFRAKARNLQVRGNELRVNIYRIDGFVTPLTKNCTRYNIFFAIFR